MIKKYILSTLLILMLTTSVVFAHSEPADFTGENYFRSPIDDFAQPKEEKASHHNDGTMPPLKILRLKTKHYFATADERKAEKQKKKEMKKALKAYKKNKVLEDAQAMDAPTDKDIEHLETGGVEESKAPQRVVIVCDDMDYSTETAVLNANGHVLVTFVQEGATLKTDHLVYDKRSNHVSAIGNVVVSKKGIDTYGESINVDLNEENALIDKPLSKMATISISAEKGYVYQNKIIQENGELKVDSSFPLELQPSGKGPRLKKMMIGIDDTSSVDDLTHNHDMYKIKVSNIIINSDKKIESLELRKAQVYKGNRHLFTVPWIKFYTNKNHDFVDGDFPELGSRRNLGMFIGPGWAFKLPFGWLLKVAPVATYKSKFGVGGFARFLSGSNETEIGYGTSKSRWVVRGEQQLDDNLKLQYAVYDHMDDWFLGRRMPKYGASLIYEKSYTHPNFFLKDMDMKYTHNASFGLFKDVDHDKYFKKLEGDGHGTVRMRYMAEVEQKILSYKNEDDLVSAYLSIVGQGSAALYGTGESQFIGRIGPRLHTQYRRWMQDVGYFQTGYDDHTPMPVFDAYRYGHSNLYVREYIRLHRLLTLSWLGSITFSDDRWSNSIFSECSFFVSIGPDDLKLNLGYDVVRENAYINFSVALDSKGSKVDYDRLEIKNPENFQSNDEKKDYYTENKTASDTKPTILKKAVVEDIPMNYDDNEDEEL